MPVLSAPLHRATVRLLRSANARMNPPRYLLQPPAPVRTVGSAGDKVDPAAADSTAYVLVAGQTGNAEYVAAALAESLTGTGARVVSLSLADVGLADLAAMKTAAIVCSTTGEGDFPAVAEGFAAALNDPALNDPDAARLTADTGFAVLALGDRSYEHFCGAGRALDARLEELGAHRLLERRDCDADFDGDAAAWIETVTRLSYERLGLGSADELTLVGTGKLADRSWQTATVGDKRRLTGPDSTKEVWHFELDVDPAAVAFAPGDGLAILPRNRPELVAALCERLGMRAGDVLAGQNESVGEILSSRKEIGKPGRRLLEYVAAATDSAELRALLSYPDHRLVDALDGLDVLDLLDTDPERAWDAAEVVGLLSTLQPRIYSIASSPADAADRIALTVAVPRWERAGRARGGVCSAFLADRVDIGDRVDVRLVPNPGFALPDDHTAPVIMVGPGTGVAPFRGFLADRAAHRAPGRNWLFFGDRNRASDYLYEAELEAWRADGHLADLHLAFSRDQPERCYVQDHLRTHGAEVYRWLQDGARLYVCGDRKAMAADVERTLVEVVAEHGGITQAQAEQYLAELKADGRYQQDVY